MSLSVVEKCRVAKTWRGTSIREPWQSLHSTASAPFRSDRDLRLTHRRYRYSFSEGIAPLSILRRRCGCNGRLPGRLRVSWALRSKCSVEACGNDGQIRPKPSKTAKSCERGRSLGSHRYRWDEKCELQGFCDGHRR